MRAPRDVACAHEPPPEVDAAQEVEHRDIEGSDGDGTDVTTAAACAHGSSEDHADDPRPCCIAGFRAYGKACGPSTDEFHSDIDVPGTSLHDRLRLQAMTEAGRRRGPEVVIVERLDRVGRTLPTVLAAWRELRRPVMELRSSGRVRPGPAHVASTRSRGLGVLAALGPPRDDRKRAVLERVRLSVGPCAHVYASASGRGRGR